MHILIIIGMPASGKNIARIYAEQKGIPYFATGDIVREAVRSRGLIPDAVNTAAVSTELRGTDGIGVTRLALQSALESGADLAFMEGMRSQPEIELIQKASSCSVIAFLAPRALRLERMISRGRTDDSADAFEARDRRELEYGTAVPIALADQYILNISLIDDAVRDLDGIIAKTRLIKSL